MFVENTPLFGLIRDRLAWLTQRQRVLAENVANADTPNYRPHDLQSFSETLRAGSSEADLRLVRTNKHHLDSASISPNAQSEEINARRVYETTPSGNGVVLEEQMAKINETAISHRLATQLYRKYLSFAKMAASPRD